VPTFADRGCHVVNVTDPYGCILCFLAKILKGSAFTEYIKPNAVVRNVVAK
jgi:hypothetical protein